MRKSQIRILKKENRLKRLNKETFDKITFHKLDWLEWLTIGLSIWFFIYPEPYGILLGALLVIPILGLFLNGIQKPSMASLVEITDNKDGNGKYDVADFIDVAAWAILIRVLLDYEFESFYSMIIPGSIACLITLTILFLTHKLIENSTKNKWWIYISLIFNISLYSYAGTYAANCTYDNSKPEIFETEVLEKSISKGRRRSTTYYVKIAPWGHHMDQEKVSISRAQYDELEVGDKIKIDLKKGLFNIPWYYIERKRERNN